MALTYEELYEIQEKSKKKKKKQNDDIAPVHSSTSKLAKPLATKVPTVSSTYDLLKTYSPTPVAPTVTTSKKKTDTKKKDDRTWFQKGSDDISKKILGSVTDIAENLGTGIIGMGEKITDSLAMMGTAMSNAQMSQLSNDELAFSAVKNIGKDKKTKNKEAENIVKKYDTAKKEAIKGTTEFVKKDMYDEEKIAKKIISAPVKNLTGIDAETDSIFGEKSDALVQSGGQLLATAGLQAVGVPWFLTTGLTSYGAEAENALNQGATFEQASMSAVISAGAEILTEKLSGGIKFGGKTLDDTLIKPFTEKITNKVLKSLANLGIDALGEGSEEVVSGILSNLGTALYKEESIGELLTSEEAVDEYIESFIGGAVLGGAGSVVQTVANRNRIELTENEQKVVDKVVEDRIEKEKADGKTVSKKKEAEIRKAVLNDMLKGYIDIDTIESVLGGDTYKTYKDTVDNETALQKEFDTLNKMKQGEMTGEQLDRRTELKQQLEELKNNSKTSEIKTKLGEDVFNLVKDSRLSESYNERARRGQTFDADLSKYDTKQQEVVKKAIGSGILNNTNRTHEFVDMVAKISADKGVPFDFVNNEKIKASGFAVEGKTVNGYKTAEGNIAVNIDSSKSLDTVVGHEITHILEGTELYEELQNAIKDYATTKGEYETRMQSLRKMYEGVYEGKDFDDKIRAELTADIVGEYLFTDADFINKLSTEKPNIFKKIFDEIKYLCKIATAGSKEARQLEKVRHQFEKAWREGAKSTDTKAKAEKNRKSDTQYSITVTDKDTIDFLENQEHITTYKSMQVVDGKLYPPMAAKVKGADGKYHWGNPSTIGVWQQATEDPANIKKIKNGVGYYTLNKGDGTSIDAAYNPYEHSSNLVLNDQFESAHRRDNLVTVECVIPVSEMSSGYRAEYSKDPTGVMEWKSGVVAGQIKDNKRMVYLSRYLKPVRILSDAETASKYKEILEGTGVSVPFNVVSPSLLAELENAGVEIDYEGSPMYKSIQKRRAEKEAKEKVVQYSLSSEQETYFQDSKVRDENGNLKVMYHGTSKGGHTVFDPFGESMFGLFGAGTYFTDNKDIAESYTEKGRGNNKQVYETYLNITNPIDMDAQADVDAWKNAFPDADYSDCVTNEECFKAMKEVFVDEQYPKWEAKDTAMDVIQSMGYDGITHIGGGRFNKNDDTRHQVYIAFEPEQIKNIDNIAPTKDADIRYSLSDIEDSAELPWENNAKDSEGNKLTQKQVDYFEGSQVVDRNGNLLKVYHTTKNDFTVFDKARKGEATEDANTYLGFFFTDDAEYMQNFPEFENGKTESYYLNMKNPIDMTDISEEAFLDIVEVMGGDVFEAADVYAQELADEQDRAKLRGDNNVSLQLGRLLDELTGEFYYQDFITELKPHYDELMSKGYDGVINYMDELFGVKEYIVLDSHQAKLTSNKNPTADVDVRYSLSDSDGKTLTSEQAEYFKNSKIRDEDGNLLKVYHGTEADFTVFDKTKGRSSMDIQGSFFSPWELDAKGYGQNVKAYYLNITNPAPEGVAYRALNKFKGQNYAGVKAREYLESLGYDGVNNGNEEYIAFNSNQIKSVTNEKPTDDPDIRYFLSEDEDVKNDLLSRSAKTFSITKPGDFVQVQRQIFNTLEKENFFNDEGKRSRTVTNRDSAMQVEINKKGIKETFNFDNYGKFSREYRGLKLATVRMLPQIIENGKLISDNVDNYHNEESSVKFAYIESDIQVDGQSVTVKIDIKKSPQKNKFWVHSVDIKEKVDGIPANDSTSLERGYSPTNSAKSISYTEDNVNRDDIALIKNGRFYGKDMKYQPTDIAPTVSETAQVDDIAPVKGYEAIEPRPDALSDEEEQWARNKMARADTEAKPTRRSELHGSIIDRIKTKFTEKGFDFDEVLNKAKNLTTVSTNDNTPQRVMEKALGYKQGQILADETVNKVAQNETEGIKWLNSFTDRKNGVLAQISKQYNIKPGSKKSAAAQMYAEGFYVTKDNKIVKYGDEELAIDFPDVKVQANIKGLARDERIRQIYDETLEAINESRRRNLYPEIQKLDNYFLHFRAMEDTFSRLGLPFNPNDIRAHDLPTDLNGVTADLKPGQPYFASAMHREGMRTSFDLLGGLERYLSSAKNQIYHIDDIQNLRALRNYIADTYGQAKGLESLDSLSEEEAQERITQVYNSHLSTFAKFLHEEANILAGKKTLIDRGIEGAVGRKWFAFFDTVNRQVGSNMVGFNVSSSLTNFLPVAQTFAKTNKFDFTKAFAQTVSSKIGSIFGKTDSFVENNPTIIRRKGAERFYRTPFQKVGDAGYVLMSAVDDVSTELIVRTKYNELIRKGMDEQKASFETDKWVSRLMGDRSLGQMPLWYNSKMLGLVTKFQLEVRNQLDSQFYDTVQEAKVSNEEIENKLLRNAKTAAKVTSTFFQLAVVQHLFGKAFESVAGYNPAFDIIEVLIKTLGLDDDEEDEDTVLDNLEEGFFALLEDLPYTSTFMDGGRIPISSALPVSELIKGEDQYGNEKSRWDTIKDVAPYYVLPTGYGQLKKTAKGVAMFSDDHPVTGSYTDSGSLRFPVEDNFKNRIQAAVFGQYANENARTYFDEGYAPLKEKQIKEYSEADMPIADYWKYREGLKDFDKQDEKAAYIKGLDITDKQKNVLKSYLYDEEGYKEENPEKYAFLEREGIGYIGYKEADEDTQSAWSWAFKHQDEYEYYKENGVLPGDYTTYYIPMLDFEDDDNDAYSWAFNNPEKAAFSKAITDNVVDYRKITSELYSIRADKDKNGKTINGSAKKKKKAYIWGLDIDEGAKYILFKNEYNADDTYNYEIIDYLNSRDDISYDEMNDICEQIGFKVNRETGRISWD